jgi:hypothetical protein
MSQQTTSARRLPWAIPLCVLGTALFAAAYGQAPLYYSNQNQYFLHGLARGSDGPLHEDWLANSLDPTPIFSGMVAFTARFLHPWAFHLYHGLLLAAYAAAMLGLFGTIVGAEIARRRWPVFLLLLVAVHAALTRWLAYRWLAQDFPQAANDYPWFLQAGVAGQYLLGAMLQPSVFGVLLVVALCLFVRAHVFLAGCCIALAATVHSTYLLPGALLTLGFMTALVKEGRSGQAMALGALTLVLVVPVLAYVLLTFGPSSPGAFAEAQDILVNFRIPHHARPGLWIDPIAGVQIAWVVLALALTWQTRLFVVLAVPFVLALLLTLVQVATGSHTLALLFPWRISAVLVPVATTVVLARLVARPGLPLGGPAAWAVSAALLVAFAVGGVWISAARLAFRGDDAELPVMDFVRGACRSGDVYFLPVAVPNLAATTRGSLSSDFKPVAEKRRDMRIIPVGLQCFRLHTGAPIYVDFKAIPYKDGEVIEWRKRLRVVETVRKQLDAGQIPEALAELRRVRVTHLIVPAQLRLAGHGLVQLYEDPSYRVYKLTPGSEGSQLQDPRAPGLTQSLIAVAEAAPRLPRL